MEEVPGVIFFGNTPSSSLRRYCLLSIVRQLPRVALVYCREISPRSLDRTKTWLFPPQSALFYLENVWNVIVDGWSVY
jgi:hypothetical protein